MIRQIITCDRCGKREDYKMVIIAGSIIPWERDVCGQTLCPACAKEFADWFKKFMWEGRKSETKQG